MGPTTNSDDAESAGTSLSVDIFNQLFPWASAPTPTPTPTPKPTGSDGVMRWYGATPQPAAHRMSDESKSNVIVPDTGAAKYWYVDPRAQNFDPMAYDQALQNHELPNDPQSEALNQLAESLRRIGALPQGTSPGF